MTSMPADETIVTSKAVAAHLQVGVQTLAKWRSEGRGPRYLRMGRAIRYRMSDIDEFIKNNVTEPTA